jgi:hypothetical protein
MKNNCIVCSPKVYEFEGVVFEVPSYSGPCPLKKNGDPKVVISKAFYDLYERFSALPLEEREKYRIGGGCISF